MNACQTDGSHHWSHRRGLVLKSYLGNSFSASSEAYNRGMFKVLVVSLACLFPFGMSYCQTGNSRAQHQTMDGEYVALEKLPNISPDDPGATWFHENRLLVRNNEAILDMAPVRFKGGKKFYSASDGGFLIYRGRFFQKDGQTFVQLRLFQSDYVAIPVGRDPYKEIKTRSVKLVAGEIDIDGVHYRRKALNEDESQRLLRLLSEEPMEKSAVP